MKTRIVKPTLNNLKLAARLIQKGEVVAFPTETIYGLGANAFDCDAVRKIYKAKGRPGDNPLIVHVSSLDMLRKIGVIPRNFEKIASKFWPGPVTFILKKNRKTPLYTTGGVDPDERSIFGARMPESKIALKFIELSGVPIVAPSANTATRPSPTLAAHVKSDLDGKIPLILDGGAAKHGVESTVIEIRGETAVVYRLGALTVEELLKSFKEVVIATGHSNKTPGRKYKHYSPKTPVVLVTGEKSEQVLKVKKIINESSLVVSLFDFKIKNQVKFKDAREATREIFKVFRKFENKYETLIVLALDDVGIGRTFNERLSRAASRVI